MKKYITAFSILLVLGSLQFESCKKEEKSIVSTTNNTGSYRIKSIGALNYTYDNDGRILSGDGEYSYDGDNVTVKYQKTIGLKFEQFLIDFNPFEYKEDSNQYVIGGGLVTSAYQHNSYYQTGSWVTPGYDAQNRLKTFVYNRYKWNSDSDLVSRADGVDSLRYEYYTDKENVFSFKRTGKSYFGLQCSKHLIRRINNDIEKNHYDFSYVFDSLNRPIKVTTNGIISTEIKYE